MVNSDLIEKVKSLRDEAIRKQTAQEQAKVAANSAVEDMKKAQKKISSILEDNPKLKDKFPALQNVTNFSINIDNLNAEELSIIVTQLLSEITEDVEGILGV